MNDPEGFLTRWSRRKRKAADSPADSADASRRDATEQVSAHPRESGDPRPGSKDSPLPGTEQSVSAEPGTSQGDGQQRSIKPGKTAEPDVDLSKLPPIESITAETDIRPFLTSGVPETLRQAALRRAWAIDPKIRDFIGLAENDWDFNAPGVPGFDLSAPTGDIKRMVAEIFGEKPDADSQPAEPQAEAELDPPPHSPNVESEAHRASHDATPPGEERGGNHDAASAASDSARTSASRAFPAEDGPADTASQQKNATQKDVAYAPGRSHGGAVPRQPRRP